MILCKRNTVKLLLKRSPYTSIQFYKSQGNERIVKMDGKFAFSAHDDVQKRFNEKEFKAKNHPGIMRVKCVTLPPKFVEAIQRIKGERKYGTSELQKRASELQSQLWQRQPPYEIDEITNAVNKSTQKLINKGQLNEDILLRDDISIEDLGNKQRRKFRKELTSHVYNWQPLEFTDYSAFVYAWARAGAEYATLVQIFHEIKKRESGFSPLSLFDFGSGCGTVSWAVETIWPNTCKENFNVDSSFEMNDLAELILQNGSLESPDDPSPLLNHTYYRQFLPTSEGLKYNLVVSSRSFFEIGDLNSRIKTVDILWRKVSPGGFLVIVEAGNKYGYSVVLSLRDYLLEICKIEREKYNLLSPIHVFAPCPHDEFCPRYIHRSKTSCHFALNYQPLFSNNICQEKFSYVVLQKQERKSQSQELPRVVQPSLKRSGHVVSRVCTPSAEIRELVATKGKHGIDCYTLCKKTNWGDFLPVVIHSSSGTDSDKQDGSTNDQPSSNDDSSLDSSIEGEGQMINMDSHLCNKSSVLR